MLVAHKIIQQGVHHLMIVMDRTGLSGGSKDKDIVLEGKVRWATYRYVAFPAGTKQSSPLVHPSGVGSGGMCQ